MTKQKWHGTAVYKVVVRYTPYNQEFKGFRIQVALPNMNGHVPFKDKYTVSFGRQYLIFQSSDYDSVDLSRLLPKHVQWLLNRGFERVMSVDEYVDSLG